MVTGLALLTKAFGIVLIPAILLAYLLGSRERSANFVGEAAGFGRVAHEVPRGLVGWPGRLPRILSVSVTFSREPAVAVYASVTDLIGNTPIVDISALSPNPRVRIYCKLEGQNPGGSVKDRAAKWMVDTAEAKGELTPGTTVLESSSGTLACAYMVGGTGIKLSTASSIEGLYPVRAFLSELGTLAAVLQPLRCVSDDRDS